MLIYSTPMHTCSLSLSFSLSLCTYNYIYICVCVCMYVCMHACMYVYVYIYIRSQFYRIPKPVSPTSSKPVENSQISSLISRLPHLGRWQWAAAAKQGSVVSALLARGNHVLPWLDTPGLQMASDHLPSTWSRCEWSRGQEVALGILEGHLVIQSEGQWLWHILNLDHAQCLDI